MNAPPLLTGAVMAGLGGFIGAGLRYVVAQLVGRLAGASAQLAGTLTVNVVGCLAMGFLATWFFLRGGVSGELRAFVIVGILGGFTTYSAFAYDKLTLIRDGLWGPALVHAALHLGLGLGAATLGAWVASRMAA